jgi:multidrug efflux pump subunit AcrB
MRQIFGNLSIGLALAIFVILLLLAANFESIRLSLIVLSTTPAVLTGVMLMLLITGTSLNLESFMGAIMAIGVAVANAILLVIFAEKNRKDGADANTAARNAAGERLRPVLMTSLAMITGMIPIGARHWTRQRRNRATRPGRHRRTGRCDRGDTARAADCFWFGAKTRLTRFALARPGRPE